MKDFGTWFSETTERILAPKKVERVLTPEAQADRDEFDAEDGCCSCHLSPPCGYCTHPGNPLNQENDDCWMEASQ